MKECDAIAHCPSPRTVAFVINEHKILDCSACKQRFIEMNSNLKSHISTIFSDDYFFEGKAGYPNYLDEKEILISHGVRYSRLVSKYKSPGKMLDVGCAAGFILSGFRSENWDCYGVEPNKTMAEYGRDELKLNIEIGSLEQYQSNEQFDLITIIQVIGHFYNIDSAIQNAYRLLKPGGLVLVESWSRSSFIAKLFGKSWHEYSPPSVSHWFSDDTLVDIFGQHKLKIIDKGFPKKQINLKHALSLLGSKTPHFRGKQKMIQFLDNKFGNLKVYYPPLDLKWYLFQK